jgi:hypothetical protein
MRPQQPRHSPSTRLRPTLVSKLRRTQPTERQRVCDTLSGSPVLAVPATCMLARGPQTHLFHAGAHNSGTPAAAGAAASAPPAAAAAHSGQASAGPTPHEQHPSQQVPPSGHQPPTAAPNGGQWANPGNPSQPVQGVPVRCASNLRPALRGSLTRLHLTRRTADVAIAIRSQCKVSVRFLQGPGAAAAAATCHHWLHAGHAAGQLLLRPAPGGLAGAYSAMGIASCSSTCCHNPPGTGVRSWPLPCWTRMLAPNAVCSQDGELLTLLRAMQVVIVLLLTLPCLAWIPCMIPDCFQVMHSTNQPIFSFFFLIYYSFEEVCFPLTSASCVQLQPYQVPIYGMALCTWCFCPECMHVNTRCVVDHGPACTCQPHDGQFMSHVASGAAGPPGSYPVPIAQPYYV